MRRRSSLISHIAPLRLLQAWSIFGRGNIQGKPANMLQSQLVWWHHRPTTCMNDLKVTNDLTQDCSSAAQDACGLRWKIGQFHREAKAVDGHRALPVS